MRIEPHYDGPPLITIDGEPGDQRSSVTRQRRRMAASLATLEPGQWAQPSRCAGWTVQDVVAHLIGTNRFWQASVELGLAGSPTRFLEGFDPAATPAAMVDAMRSMTPGETLEQFTASTDELASTFEALDDDGWRSLGESPAGHVPMRLVAAHAMWDAWVHERDVFLPLGIAVAEEDDELQSCLRYAGALGPALATARGAAAAGTYAIVATEPDTSIVLEVGSSITVTDGPPPPGAHVLAGRAVDLVELLSIRSPVDASVSPEWRGLMGGLATVFDIDLEPA